MLLLNVSKKWGLPQAVTFKHNESRTKEKAELYRISFKVEPMFDHFNSHTTLKERLLLYSETEAGALQQVKRPAPSTLREFLTM